MKKLLLILLIPVFGLFVMSFTSNDTNTNTPPISNTFEIPADVQEIIDNSCYGCHNSDSKSTKGKLKLRFDKMQDLKPGKLVGKLKKIHDAVAENDMPPKKFLAKYPEKGLTDEQKDRLSSWAINLANDMGGE